MIENKEQLMFYIKADRIMNRGKADYTFRERIYSCLFPDYIMKYLETLRKEEYLENKKSLIIRYINKKKFIRLGIKLGFSIATNVFGYGLVLPHYGTIVVGGGNNIGNYAVLHTSTCITAGKKNIGDGMYLSTGAKLINDISLGSGVSIAANTVVTKSIDDENILIAGSPGIIKKSSLPWYIRDGIEYENRVTKVEDLKRYYNI